MILVKGIIVDSITGLPINGANIIESLSPSSMLKPESTKPLVIFVSGITSSKSHKSQFEIFKDGFGSKIELGNIVIKDFQYDLVKPDAKLINSFLMALTHPILAIVLFSAGASLANKINKSPSNIYCIEPFNNEPDGTTKTQKKIEDRISIYKSIPSSNMYIDQKSYARGKGLKSGANVTNHEAGHFEALRTSAKSIANKVYNYYSYLIKNK